MSLSFKNRVAWLHLSVFWLLSFLSTQIYAVPIWRTAQVAAQSKNIGCMHGCDFGHSNSNSSDFIAATSRHAVPFRFPEFSAGHFLVIPVAAIAAVCYHVMKTRSAGRSL